MKDVDKFRITLKVKTLYMPNISLYNIGERPNVHSQIKVSKDQLCCIQNFNLNEVVHFSESLKLDFTSNFHLKKLSVLQYEPKMVKIEINQIQNKLNLDISKYIKGVKGKKNIVIKVNENAKLLVGFEWNQISGSNLTAQ